jgi:hypothetical protein
MCNQKNWFYIYLLFLFFLLEYGNLPRHECLGEKSIKKSSLHFLAFCNQNPFLLSKQETVMEFLFFLWFLRRRLSWRNPFFTAAEQKANNFHTESKKCMGIGRVKVCIQRVLSSRRWPSWLKKAVGMWRDVVQTEETMCKRQNRATAVSSVTLGWSPAYPHGPHHMMSVIERALIEWTTLPPQLHPLSTKEIDRQAFPSLLNYVSYLSTMFGPKVYYKSFTD